MLQVVYLNGSTSAYYVVPDHVPKKQAHSSIHFTKNGVDQGPAYTGIWAGHYHPAVSLYKNAKVGPPPSPLPLKVSRNQ